MNYQDGSRKGAELDDAPTRRPHSTLRRSRSASATGTHGEEQRRARVPKIMHAQLGDTHKQFHVAHAVDALGRALGTQRIPATTAGYRRFVSWAHSLGQLVTVGIEGPGYQRAGPHDRATDER